MNSSNVFTWLVTLFLQNDSGKHFKSVSRFIFICTRPKIMCIYYYQCDICLIKVISQFSSFICGVVLSFLTYVWCHRYHILNAYMR